jgi:hypothetical protein
MPAVAWLLLAAALGAGVLLSGRIGRDALKPRSAWIARGLCVASLSVFAWQQAPRFREQVWFFGRASRNIRDQHVRAGRYLKHWLKPRRVLLGDAGALSYASDVPALDIIGLGGYRDLPFARATRQGVEAALELIERLPVTERPDMMALYPSWWGLLPMWFGRYITEFPVSGNVICGGASKVIYAADWSPFNGSGTPFTLAREEEVRDELDLADVVNETQHGYALDRPAIGYVQMKLFDNPSKPGAALWDAGRLAPMGAGESFVLKGIRPGRPLRLIFRAAPSQATAFTVNVDGAKIGQVTLDYAESWLETAIVVPQERVRDRMTIRLEPGTAERALYHVWAVQPR